MLPVGHQSINQFGSLYCLLHINQPTNQSMNHQTALAAHVACCTSINQSIN
jgi:hypothetical protein